MAFKFKVKKRPNLGQAVASSFAAGAVQGGQMALQKMLQEREENKKNSSQNLNTFNSLISGLPQTPENRSSILNARLSVLQGGDPVLAVKAISDGGLDYETPAETKKREENELKNLEATEESLRRKIGMVGSQPTPEEIAARKAENKNSDADLLKEAEILEEQVKRDIGMVGAVPTPRELKLRELESDELLGLNKKDAQKNAYNKKTGERVFATNIEMSNNPDLVPISAAPKEDVKSQTKTTLAQVNKTITQIENSLNPLKRNITGLKPLSPELRAKGEEQLNKYIQLRDSLMLPSSNIGALDGNKLEVIDY